MAGGEQVGSIVFDEPEGPGLDTGAEELATGPARSGPSRRQLLLGAAGLAGAGAAGWWWSRGPEPVPPKPAVLSGPEPSWTFRAEEPQAPERVTGRTVLPLVASGSELTLLTPETGAVAKRISLPGGPDDTLVAAGDLLYRPRAGEFSVLGYGVPMQVFLPPVLGESWQLHAVDGDALYGRSALGTEPVLFAMSASKQELLWTRPAVDPGGGFLTDLQTAEHGGVLLARSTRDEVVAVHPLNGDLLWTAPADQGLSWREVGSMQVYVANRATGIRALSLLDGSVSWTVEGREGARPLRPHASGPYLLWDTGLVTRHDEATGEELWAARLPFRLDWRCRPVAVAGSLFVPGPLAGGVCALDERTGAIRWTLRDAEPGVQYWRVATDGRRVFVGHDRVLHGLAPA
ncbi:PQQ-binding-like beta-propeller repeat protein [Kitasatospora sp. NPDC096147]|uniref:outer membrane protein assembly factor BamB family protein n=1 Tax=Kitasatospora sp. NPDC096147 TaxID=3364093 RepID=UPI0037FE8BAF